MRKPNAQHRSVDTKVVVTRSLVYVILVSSIAALFAGINWLMTKTQVETRLEIAVDIVTALLIGFSLKAVQQRLGAAINSLLFRERRRGDTECENIMAALYSAKSRAQRMRLLVAAPTNAFALASAAIFERTDDGGFMREAAVGWPVGTTWHLLPGDPLIRTVIRMRDAPRLGEDVLSDHDLPTGPAQPAIGLSLRVGGQTEALLFYGAHKSGAMLDPDEVGALQKIVQAANDARTSQARTSSIQRIAIILLSAAIVSFNAPAFFKILTAGPVGSFGCSYDYSGTVTDVSPGGAAALAGLKVGDRIDLDAMAPEYQRDVDYAQSYLPGKTSEWVIVRGEKSFVARLVSQPYFTDAETIRDNVVSRLVAILSIIVGSFLLLLRPSKMAFGFYLFCLGLPFWDIPFLYLHWGWAVAIHILSYVFETVSAVGLLVFALRFPHDMATGWKARIDTSTPFVYLGSAMIAVAAAISHRGFSSPVNIVWEVTIYATFAAATAAFGSTFLRSLGNDKRLLRWTIVGCVLGSADVPLKLGLNTHFADAPAWVWHFSDFLLILIPIAVAYWAVRTRPEKPVAAIPAGATA
jgi:hypothetical protein